MTAEFEIIPEKQKLIQDIAERYITGERLPKLAIEAGMHEATLRKLLMFQCGTKWQHSFECKLFGIDEQFETEVPELLDKETRDKIRWRVERNKTVDHSHLKHKYLLKSLVRCGHCGTALVGQTKKSGFQIYRHNKPCCGKISSISARKLELPVLAHVCSVFSDSEAADKAIKMAVPDLTERKDLEAEKKRTIRKRKKLEAEKQNLVRALRKGIISDDDASVEMEQIREDQLAAKNTLQQAEYRLKNMPDPDDKMNKIALDTLKGIFRSYYRSPSHILEMDFDQQRKMLTHVFDGIDEKGDRHGIKLYAGNNPRSKVMELRWVYKFDEIEGLPMPNGQIKDMLGLDENEYADLLKEGTLKSVSTY